MADETEAIYCHVWTDSEGDVVLGKWWMTGCRASCCSRGRRLFFFFFKFLCCCCCCCFSFNAAGPIAHAIFQKFVVLKSFYNLWEFHTWFCVEFHFKLHLRLDKSFYTWPSKWIRANISLWMLLSESESGRSLVWSLWCPAAFAGLKYRQCCFNPTSPDDS